MRRRGFQPDHREVGHVAHDVVCERLLDNDVRLKLLDERDNALASIDLSRQDARALRDALSRVLTLRG